MIVSDYNNYYSIPDSVILIESKWNVFKNFEWPEDNFKLINSLPLKNYVYGIQPILILVYAADEYTSYEYTSSEYTYLEYTFSICKHFDPSVDAGSRYYKHDDYHIRRVYDWNETNAYNYDNPQLPFVNDSCIGEFPGKKLDECYFNGYLEYYELCNPCEKKEFKEQCDELCKTTTGPPFGAYDLR